MNLDIRQEDKDRIVDVLARQAATSATGTPQMHLTQLVRSANLPERWWVSLSGVWTGSPQTDARTLVEWALARDVNPQDGRFTTLASILTPALEDLGRDQAAQLVAVILAYGLYLDDGLAAALRRRYGVPEALTASPPTERVAGAPDPIVAATEGELELQSWLKPEPPWLDVGFLLSAMARVPLLCRVETDDRRPAGTGFYIAKDLVLTNWHVLSALPGAEPTSKLEGARLRFGAISGAANDGIVVAPESGGLVASSPFEELDFALIRLPSGTGLQLRLEPPAVVHDRVPEAGSALHILQHPEGDTLKLALSANGVNKVLAERGLLQYVTRAAGGSSGSPCFDDDWKVVGLHHGERARTFGAVREGIIMRAIWERIGALLP